MFQSQAACNFHTGNVLHKRRNGLQQHGKNNQQREGTGLRCLFERQTRQLAVLFGLGSIGIDGMSISAFAFILVGMEFESEHRKGQNAYGQNKCGNTV